MSIYSQILIAALIVAAAWVYVQIQIKLWLRSLKAVSSELKSTSRDIQAVQDSVRRTVETFQILKGVMLSPKTSYPVDEEFIKAIDAQIEQHKHQEEARRQAHAEDHPKRRKVDQ